MQWGLNVNGLVRQCCGTVDNVGRALCGEWGQRVGVHGATMRFLPRGISRWCGMQVGLDVNRLMRQRRSEADSICGALCRELG